MYKIFFTNTKKAKDYYHRFCAVNHTKTVHLGNIKIVYYEDN